MGKYRMPAGTELVITTETKRNPWKLIAYVTDDILCVEAADGKQTQVYKKDVVLRHSSRPHFKKK